jgi:DnaK suppressor protein
MPTAKKQGIKVSSTKGLKKSPVSKSSTAPSAVSRNKSTKTVSQPVPRSAEDLLTFKNFKPYPLKKGEPYMNEKQEVHFRAILLAWKRELMEEVDRTMHYMQDEAANFPDPNDRASQESDFTLELRARDRERKLIKKIDEALVRLDNNEYGDCEVCGVEIGIRRLEARPTATLCIDCKTLDEIREKQMGD